MASKTKIYGIADKAWQVVVGCDPHMPCAPRCWARKTVARVVECQRGIHPERAEFFQIALTPDGGKWSGDVRLDQAHLRDPLKWKKPAVIATGFHGDWGRLGTSDQLTMLEVMERAKQHLFLPLTKQPQDLHALLAHDPLPNVNIGCSVMNQSDADKLFPAMDALSAMGWATHVWYEPALGPVNWGGWEFLALLIMGGESGPGARPCNVAWFRYSLCWCKQYNVKAFVKQLGAVIAGDPCEFPTAIHDDGDGDRTFRLLDRKGSDPAEWPDYLRVQQLPEVLDAK